MRHILAACAAGFLAACTTPATETAEAKPDPRQGKEVSQVCFNSQIRNWRENEDDRKSVIIEKDHRQEYKLDLIGACQPDDAFLNIGLTSRVGGGTCLSTGDKLVTDSRFDGSCSIRRIYEWHKDVAANEGAPASGAVTTN
jgi:hypothetical protein